MSERVTPDATPVSAADALADAALRISEATIDGSLEELRRLAGGSTETPVVACDLLRLSPADTARDRAVQHMAFSLVSALFRREISVPRPGAA